MKKLVCLPFLFLCFTSIVFASENVNAPLSLLIKSAGVLKNFSPIYVSSGRNMDVDLKMFLDTHVPSSITYEEVNEFIKLNSTIINSDYPLKILDSIVVDGEDFTDNEREVFLDINWIEKTADLSNKNINRLKYFIDNAKMIQNPILEDEKDKRIWMYRMKDTVFCSKALFLPSIVN